MATDDYKYDEFEEDSEKDFDFDYDYDEDDDDEFYQINQLTLGFNNLEF